MLDKCTRTLRVHSEATADEIRQAFIKLARRYPPEHFPAKFAEIKHCSDLLNLEDKALEEYLSHISSTEVMDLIAMLLPEDFNAPIVDGSVPELDIAAYMDLLNPEQRRREMLSCLDQVSRPESYYRRRAGDPGIKTSCPGADGNSTP